MTDDFSDIGFEISSNNVARIVPHLIKAGKYDHTWPGIAGVNLTPDLARQLGLRRISKRVVAASVTPGSPADKAGIIDRVQNDGTPMGDTLLQSMGTKSKE